MLSSRYLLSLLPVFWWVFSPVIKEFVAGSYQVRKTLQPKCRLLRITQKYLFTLMLSEQAEQVWKFLFQYQSVFENCLSKMNHVIQEMLFVYFLY